MLNLIKRDHRNFHTINQPPLGIAPETSVQKKQIVIFVPRSAAARLTILALAMSPRSILIVGMVQFMLSRQSLRLLDVRLFLVLRQSFPGRSQFLADQRVAHAGIGFQDFASLLAAPNHETVHRSTYMILVLTRGHGVRAWSVYWIAKVRSFADLPTFHEVCDAL